VEATPSLYHEQAYNEAMSTLGTPQFTVIFDGDCGLCRRSLKVLRATDILKKFVYVDFHREDIIQSQFPALVGSDFEHAMYAVDPSGKSYRGFFAFKRLIWGSPILWLLIPVFYFPGASFLGPKIYGWVARNRKHMYCKIG
jgi:predicted DCC family thiol-disulfide oxidoreductase YuxK